jgi:hypothetical protein
MQLHLLTACKIFGYGSFYKLNNTEIIVFHQTK